MDDTTDGVEAVRPGRVVVVGHDRAELRRLSAVLEPSGRHVVTVASGDEARTEVGGDGATVVVLDTRSPGIDPFEAVQDLRADGTASTPVLVLVGDGRAAVADGIYDLGAVDVVTTSVGDRVLRARVAVLAELAAATSRLAAQADHARRTEELVERHAHALAAQQSVMRALATDSPGGMMPRVGQKLARGLDWEVGAYWVLAGDEAQCVESWFDPAFSAPELARLQAASIAGSPPGVVGRAAASGSPVWLPLAELDGADPYVRAALAAGLADALAVPITVDSTVRGVIELHRTAQRPPDAHTLGTLEAIAALVGQFARAEQIEDETAALKNGFFALVSHELLTPLTSILGYLEELLDGASGEFTPEQEQDLEVIDRNARRLYRLVDDLMFVAQVESGKLTLDVVGVDPVAVVHEAVEVVRPAAKAREIQIVVRVDSVGTVSGDVKRLGQVVDHLLSNAVKFSHPDGLVEVVLRRDAGEAVIEVIDQGHGIPLAEQAQVFDRFRRSTVAADLEIPGIGLGLSITKVIVEAHGGTIGMHSVEGVGSTFTVRLPLEEPGDDDGKHQE